MRALWAFAVGCCLVSACATELPPPVATFESIQQLRASNIAPLALGEFDATAELATRDHGVGFRADSLHPPGGGTFSGYLKQSISAQLTGAGKLAPDAAHVLSAQLTRIEVSTMGADSHAALAADFRLRVNGTLVFDKEIVVEDSWPSAFMGAEAIPDAENHYSALFPKLFAALLADPAFLSAAS
jgi:hypothetical protein